MSKTFGDEIFGDYKLVTMPDGTRCSVPNDGSELEKTWASARALLREVASGKMPTEIDLVFLSEYSQPRAIDRALVLGMWADMRRHLLARPE